MTPSVFFLYVSAFTTGFSIFLFINELLKRLDKRKKHRRLLDQLRATGSQSDSSIDGARAGQRRCSMATSIPFIETMLRIASVGAISHFIQMAEKYVLGMPERNKIENAEKEKTRALLFPIGDIAELLIRANLMDRYSVESVVRAQIVSLMGVALVGLIFGTLFSSAPLMVLGVIGGGLLGAKAPHALITSRARQRTDACINELPEMVEIIALGSEAGISFPSCLELYGQHFDGILAEEVRLAYASFNTGAQSLSAALLSLSSRLTAPSVTNFVSTAIQAIKMGTPLSELLISQSEEARRAKRARIEEHIAKAPVKMLIPMGTLILPAMLLFVMGPVLLGLQA